jgi:uncharacterized repeat protein (TIGR04042 family)
MFFTVRWPDSSTQRYYSPSLVVKDFLTPGRLYPVGEFVGLSRSALEIASERVRQKYGYACSAAAAQLAAIEEKAAGFTSSIDATVTVEEFQL